jgi:D-alanyl-D-alanine dipeptidase
MFQRYFPFVDDGSVDMGTSFDLFHHCSHPSGRSQPFLDNIASEACGAARAVLRDAMVRIGGFLQSDCEWWHFWLRDGEPFPYDEARPEWGFDFPI